MRGEEKERLSSHATRPCRILGRYPLIMYRHRRGWEYGIWHAHGLAGSARRTSVGVQLYRFLPCALRRRVLAGSLLKILSSSFMTITR